MKKLIALLCFVFLIPACYKCPGDSGYSPQCGPTKTAASVK